MAKAGLVSDWRGFQFGESHAAWYACLIKSRAIGKVTAAESAKQSNPSKTSATIKKLRSKHRNTATGLFLERMLTAPPPTEDDFETYLNGLFSADAARHYAARIADNEQASKLLLEGKFGTALRRHAPSAFAISFEAWKKNPNWMPTGGNTL